MKRLKLLITLLLIFGSLFDIETINAAWLPDFTVFTEVDDAENHYAINSNWVNVTDLERQENVYVYLNQSAVGDFDYNVTFVVNALEAGDADSRTAANLIAYGSIYGTNYDLNNGADAIQVYFAQVGSGDTVYQIEINTRLGGVLQDSQKTAATFDVGTTYYGVFKRASNIPSFSIYSDASRTVLIETIALDAYSTSMMFLNVASSVENTNDPNDWIEFKVSSQWSDGNESESSRWNTWTKYGVDPIWEKTDYSWSAKTPDSFIILCDPNTTEPYLYSGKYWAAFTSKGDGKGAGLAYSTDLFNWTDTGYGEILPLGGSGAWDVNTIQTNMFLYMGDVPGHEYDFYLFYAGYDGTHLHIGVTRSANLQSWAKYAGNPFITFIPSSWAPDSNGIEDFRLVLTTSGDWYGCYEANAQRNMVSIGTAMTNQTLPLSGWVDMGQAFSSTQGADTFCANPTIIKRIENGTVVYYMLYEWLYSGDTASRAYECYTTEDQFHTLNAWIQRPDNPAITHNLAWESNDIIPNGFIHNTTHAFCYYTGAQGLDSKKIGLATRKLILSTSYDGGAGTAYNDGFVILDHSPGDTLHRNQWYEAAATGGDTGGDEYVQYIYWSFLVDPYTFNVTWSKTSDDWTLTHGITPEGGFGPPGGILIDNSHSYSAGTSDPNVTVAVCRFMLTDDMPDASNVDVWAATENTEGNFTGFELILTGYFSIGDPVEQTPGGGSSGEVPPYEPPPLDPNDPYSEQDSDGDGVPDSDDWDDDNDGIPDDQDTDDDGDGVPDQDEQDQDGDGVPDDQDTDDDGDGVPDDEDLDDDNDNIPDEDEDDTDDDGIRDDWDGDIDGDGIPNSLDDDPYTRTGANIVTQGLTWIQSKGWIILILLFLLVAYKTLTKSPKKKRDPFKIIPEVKLRTRRGSADGFAANLFTWVVIAVVVTLGLSVPFVSRLRYEGGTFEDRVLITAISLALFALGGYVAAKILQVAFGVTWRKVQTEAEKI